MRLRSASLRDAVRAGADLASHRPMSASWSAPNVDVGVGVDVDVGVDEDVDDDVDPTDLAVTTGPQPA